MLRQASPGRRRHERLGRHPGLSISGHRLVLRDVSAQASDLIWARGLYANLASLGLPYPEGTVHIWWYIPKYY
jgi:hypothetical protein